MLGLFMDLLKLTEWVIDFKYGTVCKGIRVQLWISKRDSILVFHFSYIRGIPRACVIKRNQNYSRNWENVLGLIWVFYFWKKVGVYIFGLNIANNGLINSRDEFCEF